VPPRKAKAPSEAAIKRAADRAEGKDTEPEYSPLDPPEVIEMEELEEAESIEVEGVSFKPKSRAGRPTKYKPEYAKIARALVKAGQTIPEIAEAFGISVSTIWLWRGVHPEFMQSFIESSEHFDGRVEAALGQRAVGYNYPSIKVFQHNGMPVIVPIDVHVPPDVNAAKFWLAARQGGKWRVEQQVEVGADGEAFLKLWQGLNGKKNKPPKE
jgi:hypothetical protein